VLRLESRRVSRSQKHRFTNGQHPKWRAGLALTPNVNAKESEGRRGSPPGVILSTQLDVGAHHRHLYGDQHCESAHHKTEAKDVIEVPLQASNPISVKYTSY